MSTTALPTRQQALAILTAPGQPYELQTREVAGRPLRLFVNAPASLRQLFEAPATEQPFRVLALIHN